MTIGELGRDVEDADKEVRGQLGQMTAGWKALQHGMIGIMIVAGRVAKGDGSLERACLG